MKKFVGFILVLSLVLSAFMFITYADDYGKVEVRFSVGDEIIRINGSSFEVEKPYIAGEGVTLVPLRVITEAFGAEVQWNGDDKSITLIYPSVNIFLQIGNPTAEVNSYAEKLLHEPELTEQGITMVPLRFISETFGAVVTYNDATKEITVIKESANTDKKTVVGTSNAARIGDSYYGWSIDNPIEMHMSERTFDGIYTEFEYDDDNYFSITINPVDDEFDFEKYFSTTKNSFSDYTLVKADKDTSDQNLRTMFFQAKNKEIYWYASYYVMSNYIIEVLGMFNNKETTQREKFIKLLDTFECKYDENDIYDLSNIEAGKRRFEAENLDFSIDIPQDYYMQTAEDSENIFSFMKMSVKDNISGITIGVYSADDVGGSKKMANDDHDRVKREKNEKLIQLFDVKSKKYNEFNAYEYSYTITNSAASDKYVRDVFYDKGDYVFNITVYVKTPNGNAEQFADEILNSVKSGTPDSKKVGIILRNTFDEEGKYISKANSWSMELPNYFQLMGSDLSSSTYYSSKDGITINVQQASGLYKSIKELKETMVLLEKKESRRKDTEIIVGTDSKKIGDNSYTSFTELIKSDNDAAYLQYFVSYSSGITMTITVLYPELAYSKRNIQVVEDIVASYKDN